MAYTQQYSILLSNHILNPDPCEQFVMDIIAFVRCWQPMHDILLCLDANDNTTESNDKGIERIIDETNLIDLHQYHHPQLLQPTTYSRGCLMIDYCLGTNGFVVVLTRTWMLPFSLPMTLSSDHRMMGLEFNHDILFGLKVSPTSHSYQCRIYSTAFLTVRKFNDKVACECAHLHLYEQAAALYSKYIFTPQDHAVLEEIDQKLTKILTWTDHKLAQYCTLLWSQALHQAFLSH